MVPHHKFRIASATIACAALAAPSLAGAKTVPQDIRDHQEIKELVALFGNPWAATRRPSVGDAAAAAKTVLQGDTLSTAPGTERIVDDSFRDPTPIVTPAGDRIVDDSFRDPTPIVTPAGDRIVDDSFRDASPVVGSPASGGSLNWEDFGIGAGAMFGLTLLLAGLGLGALVVRHRAGRIQTR